MEKLTIEFHLPELIKSLIPAELQAGFTLRIDTDTKQELFDQVLKEYLKQREVDKRLAEFLNK